VKRRSATGRILAPVVAATVALLLLAGCGVPVPGTNAGDGRLRVVAAENVWGQIASELGGERVDVTSIVANPNTDPHEYEPTVADARAIADADLLVLNGVGYDPWVSRLAAASPDASRAVVDAGKLAGVPAGGNPHLWYSPDTVHAVAARIASEYERLDPAGARYYAARLREFEDVTLAGYDALVAQVRGRYAGTPVGASESIVVPLARALGLRVLTPESFTDAVSEGTDPTASAKSEADAQVRTGAVKVFIYNAQNATPDVATLVAAARTRGIPVVTVSETIPAGETFAGWQTAQLDSIAAALKEAVGR